METESTETVNESTSTITPETPSGEQEPTIDWSALSDLGDPDTIRKQITHAREWEKRAKANVEAAKELEALKAERMTDNEKAIAEAERRGRAAATAEMSRQLAEARLRSAAAGKVADVDALIELVDINRFVTDDGVDDASIAATIERFSKVAQASPKFDKVELGAQGERPRQLTRDDIKSMTPEQVNEARRKGLLDALLKA